MEDLQEHQLAVERRWGASVELHFAHFEGKCGQSHSLHSVEGHCWVALEVSEAHQTAVTGGPWEKVGPLGERVQENHPGDHQEVQVNHQEDQVGVGGLPFQGDP